MAKRIPIVTDTHFGSRGDSEVLYHVMEEFYSRVFWPAIDAEATVTDILHLGDMTDRRHVVNFQTLAFAKRVFFEPARQRGIRIHWLLGNHDLPFKQRVSLSSHEAFREYENVIVYATATQVMFEQTPVLLVPWLCQENYAHSMTALAQFAGSVVMGHFELSGFEMFRGVTNEHGLDPAPLQSFAQVFSGHYHHQSKRDNIWYLGSPYEMVWSDHGDPHGFHWWTPTTREITFVENPHHLFFKFVYNDEGQPSTYVKSLLEQIKLYPVQQRIIKVIVQRKTQLLWYDAFVDATLKLGCHDVQFVDDTGWATSLDETGTEAETSTMDTRSTVQWYLQGLPWSNTQVQQDVTMMMMSLYEEAAEHAKTVARG